MSQLIIDFIPIIAFFVAYKVYNIFTATIVLMVTSLLQITYLFFSKRKIEKMNWITLLLVLSMGALTLFFHDAQFIKWKPTIIYWLFSFAFLFTPMFSTNNLVEHMIGSKLKLPEKSWKTLNVFFIIFFLFMGLANLYVLKNFDTNTWVNYKLFGTLGLTIVFVVILSGYIMKNKLVPIPNE